MTNCSLPSHWAVSTLGEICTIIQGQSPPSNTYNFEGKGLPFLQGKAEFGSMYPKAVKWCMAPKKISEPEDVLISVRAPVGPTNLCAVQSCIGRGLAAIRTHANMLPKFILYALRASEEELRSKSTGTTFQAIRGDDLRTHPIGLPPLAEQERIVAEIEKQFTRLDAAEAALRRVEVNLKRYRASVLKAACEGKLVPTEAELAEAEGRDNEHAEQLLESILAERRAHWESQEKRRGKYKEPVLPDTPDSPELPTGWVWATVDQLILGSPQNGIYKPKSLYGDGIPILRIEDYQDFHVRTLDQLQRLRITAEETSIYGLAANHLIINRVNSPSHLGKTLLVPDHFSPAVFESNMMRVIPSRFVVSPFLAHYLRSPEGRGRLTSNAKWAVNQASINQSDVCTTPVPVPPLHEQHRIIAEVERSLSIIQQLVTAVEASLKRVERLRQSILKQAFAGQLLPQDPDDEPASLLLERIREERGADHSVTSRSPQLRLQEVKK
ncbi:MAG: restriction endonuclease subunit S [Caldilineaceae bacterium]|nr:restriction endonuclease subunit S [Caldilineaceae bacterium]